MSNAWIFVRPDGVYRTGVIDPFFGQRQFKPVESAEAVTAAFTRSRVAGPQDRMAQVAAGPRACPIVAAPTAPVANPASPVQLTKEAVASALPPELAPLALAGFGAARVRRRWWRR